MKKISFTKISLAGVILFLLFFLPVSALSGDSGYPGDMIVVGAAELITLEPSGLTYPSRIDTGAALSSLNAYDIKIFEREGRSWVRFHTSVSRDIEELSVELPVERMVQVRQANRPGLQIRYIVLLQIRLGDQGLHGEFSLSDRRNMSYPLLLGRNLLAGNALVDVSREYVQISQSEKKGLPDSGVNP